MLIFLVQKIDKFLTKSIKTMSNCAHIKLQCDSLKNLILQDPGMNMFKKYLCDDLLICVIQKMTRNIRNRFHRHLDDTNEFEDYSGEEYEEILFDPKKLYIIILFAYRLVNEKSPPMDMILYCLSNANCSFDNSYVNDFGDLYEQTPYLKFLSEWPCMKIHNLLQNAINANPLSNLCVSKIHNDRLYYKNYEGNIYDYFDTTTIIDTKISLVSLIHNFMLNKNDVYKVLKSLDTMLESNNEPTKNIKLYSSIISLICKRCYINDESTKLIMKMNYYYGIQVSILENLVLDAATISERLKDELVDSTDEIYRISVCKKAIINSQWISHKTIDFKVNYRHVSVLWFLQNVRLTNEEINTIDAESFDFLLSCRSCYAQKLSQPIIKLLLNLVNTIELISSVRTKTNLISYNSSENPNLNAYVINTNLSQINRSLCYEDRNYLCSKYSIKDVDQFAKLFLTIIDDQTKHSVIHRILQELHNLNNIEFNEMIVDKVLEKYGNDISMRTHIINHVLIFRIKLNEETIIDMINELNRKTIWFCCSNNYHTLNIVNYLMQTQVKIDKNQLFPELIRNDKINEDIAIDEAMTDDLWKLLQIHHYKYNVSLLAKGKYCITYDVPLNRIQGYEFVKKHLTFCDDIMDTIVSFI